MSKGGPLSPRVVAKREPWRNASKQRPVASGAIHHRRKVEAEQIPDFPRPVDFGCLAQRPWKRGSLPEDKPHEWRAIDSRMRTDNDQSVRTPVRGCWLPVGEPRFGKLRGCC